MTVARIADVMVYIDEQRNTGNGCIHALAQARLGGIIKREDNVRLDDAGRPLDQ